MTRRASLVRLAPAIIVPIVAMAVMTVGGRTYAQSFRQAAAIQAKQSALPPADPFPGVSLKVGDEKVPPGGIVQVKVFVTEPRPISTAGGKFTFDGLDSIDGIALMSPGGDAMGVAMARGADLSISIVSPSTTFGTEPDYPILTVAGRVAATTPVGSSFPLAVDLASLQFTDPSGAIYPLHANDGELMVGPNVNVDDVIPGSAELPPGGTVSILGRNFQAKTKVRFEETLLSDVAILDSSHIVATLADPARMHGLGIRVENRDGAKTRYFAYQRVRRAFTSSEATLRDAVPVFDARETFAAAIDVPGVPTGVALQNRGLSPVTAAVDLLDGSGGVLASTVVALGAGRYVVAEISELFGTYSASQVVRVTSAAPIQVMGIAVTGPGSASPIVPR